MHAQQLPDVHRVGVLSLRGSILQDAAVEVHQEGQYTRKKSIIDVCLLYVRPFQQKLGHVAVVRLSQPFFTLIFLKVHKTKRSCIALFRGSS